MKISTSLAWIACVTSCLSGAANASALIELPYAPAPIDNPLKGFVPYDSTSTRALFPHSLEWFYIPLSELMPAKDTFTWAPLDRRLDAIASRHCQAVFRVYLDYPSHVSGIPKFLLEEGLVVRPYDDAKNHGKSLSPDYEDPRLRAALRTFIAAFGARYDGDPRIGFLTAGLLGFWGEWHTESHKGWFASKAVQLEVINGYARAFHQTRILLRYPAGLSDSEYADNRRVPMGYHDDSFAWATRPIGKPNSWYFLDRMTRAKVLDKWKTEPIGGEVRPEVWDTLWNDPTGAPKGQEYLACVEDTHATWLMNSGAFHSSLKGDARDRALAGARRLGYEIQVARAAVDRTSDGALKIALELVNHGVAPFYYPWKGQIALVDGKGQRTDVGTVELQLTQVLPGESYSRVSHCPIPAATPTGDYTVVLRVANPMAGGKPLRFANLDQDRTLPGWLSLGQIKL